MSENATLQAMGEIAQLVQPSSLSTGGVGAIVTSITYQVRSQMEAEPTVWEEEPSAPVSIELSPKDAAILCGYAVIGVTFAGLADNLTQLKQGD